MCYGCNLKFQITVRGAMAAVTKPLIDVSNINEKVYHFLKDRLLDLTFPPGHKINLRRLQKELGVSYTPIKDAIFRLAGEGLVEVSSRRGTFVKQVSERDIREIAETRIILETAAVDLIAERISDEQLAELRRLFEATLDQNTYSDYRLFLKRDNQFHLAIIRFTGNQRLLTIYEHLNAHMQIIRFRFAPKSQIRLGNTDEAHRRILEALEAHDARRAKEELTTHLMTARDAFLKQGANN